MNALRTATVLALVALASCSRSDGVREKEIEVTHALNTFMAGIDISIIESKGNSNFFAPDLSPTNKYFEFVPLACDQIWINTNAYDWLVSATNGHPESNPALIGMFKVVGGVSAGSDRRKRLL